MSSTTASVVGVLRFGRDYQEGGPLTSLRLSTKDGRKIFASRTGRESAENGTTTYKVTAEQKRLGTGEFDPDAYDVCQGEKFEKSVRSLSFKPSTKVWKRIEHGVSEAEGTIEVTFAPSKSKVATKPK